MSDEKKFPQEFIEYGENISDLLSDANKASHDDSEFEMKGSVLLHHLVESINPNSLVDLLSMVTNAQIKLGSGTKGTTVIMASESGDMIFSNNDKLARWKGNECEESLLLEATYRYASPIYIDLKVQAELNRELVFGRIETGEGGRLELKSAIYFRGGRNAENVLWEILELSKEALLIKSALFD